jgi:hypothetical protein
MSRRIKHRLVEMAERLETKQGKVGIVARATYFPILLAAAMAIGLLRVIGDAWETRRETKRWILTGELS